MAIIMDRYKITFETYDKVAQAYQDKFMDMDLYDDTYDAFCKLVDKRDAKIFEIGCGPGNITCYLLSKRPDFTIEAIDAAPNMIRLAKANNPAADFRIMDCREIGGIDAVYDGIVCGFCLPYLSKEDCVKFFGDCARLLPKDGILYFSVAEGDYSKSGFETGKSGLQLYMHYHQADYLLDYLTQSGFELIELIRKSYPATGPDSTHLIFIARKT